MISFEPSIFFVDDKKNEVEDIVELYRKEGYGVKYLNADPIEGDEIPLENSYSDALLVFLDIYYNADRTLDEEKCAEWVSGIVNKDSFYILVIWSQDTDEAEKVINKIKESNRAPFVTIIKQKSDYHRGNNKWDFEKLQKDVQTTIDERPELKELAKWKKSIKSAANLIIGHLSNSEDHLLFTNKLKKIILGHGGISYLGNDNYIEKQKVLFDALDNILVSNSKNTRLVEDILEINKANLYNTQEHILSEIDTKLNSWFHFKIHPYPLDQNSIDIGLLSKFKTSEFKNRYGIFDDINITTFFKHQIEEAHKRNSSLKIENICVLLTRPCDIAQNKFGKNLKLLSGLLINNPIRKGGNGKSKHDLKVSGTKPDSIKIYDHLYFSDDEKDSTIVFDYRYSFSLSKNEFYRLLEKFGTLNKELLSEILVEYSAYSSRLGITQII